MYKFKKQIEEIKILKTKNLIIKVLYINNFITNNF